MIYIIVLNEGQNKAYKKSYKWYKNRTKQTFEIGGYAGTGKSTIVFTLINALGLDPSYEVLFMTYVGKATLALRRNGLNAKTIHSSLYYRTKVIARDDDGNIIYNENNKPITKGVFKLKDSLDKHIKLIVVDEWMMINQKIYEDILSFNLPVMLIGDSGQLPSVFGKPVKSKPDVFLDEVVRQKEGDPILYLAHKARKGEFIEYNQYGKNCFVVDESILKYKKIYTKPDIILCAKNKTRDKINDIFNYDIKRKKTNLPIYGDKIVCRKNNYDTLLYDIPLVNGLFGYVVNAHDETFNGKTINIDFMPDFMPYEWFSDIPLDYKYFNLNYEERKNYNSLYAPGNLFEYGYGSTIHLALVIPVYINLFCIS